VVQQKARVAVYGRVLRPVLVGCIFYRWIYFVSLMVAVMSSVNGQVRHVTPCHDGKEDAMETQRQLCVSIIGDSPFGVVGLKAILSSMGVNVRTTYDCLEALCECESGDDALIIDIYFADETQIFRDAQKRKGQIGGRFVIFSDEVWTSCGCMTFIQRSVQCDTMKKHLHHGIVGDKKTQPLPLLPPKFDQRHISLSHAESFVLSEWLRGRTITDIGRLSHRSTQTISTHKRNAMKKLMVKNNTELYWALLKKK
jgi:DNA-binding NarL/FixJ family response regulator